MHRREGWRCSFEYNGSRGVLAVVGAQEGSSGCHHPRICKEVLLHLVLAVGRPDRRCLPTSLRASHTRSGSDAH